MRFNSFLGGNIRDGTYSAHNIKNAGGQGVVLEFPFYISRQKFRSQLQAGFRHYLLCSPYIHVLHEILFIRSRKLQTIDIDFSNHLVYGTTCKVSL